MSGPAQTPEDKLLEIIENPSVQAMVKEGQVPAGVAGRSSLLSASGLAVLWRRAGLGVLNRVFLVVCLLLLALGLWHFRTTQLLLDNKFTEITRPENVKDQVFQENISKSINFQQTLTLAKEHNIFTLYHDQTSLEGLIVGDGQATANLKLVGILWSETDPQAMVEDTVEQKTHLLGVGDSVAQLTVRSITKEKVILAREDRIWELR